MRCLFNTSILGILLWSGSIFAAKSVGLKDLFSLAENNKIFKSDYEALQKQAAAKLSEVNRMAWLPTLDLKATGGVVPDAKVLDPNNVNSYRSNDFENDFSLGHFGPFIQIQIEAIQPLFTFGKIENSQRMAQQGTHLALAENKKNKNELRYLIKKAYYTLLLSSESLVILKDVEGKLNQANEKVEELLVKNAENVSETDRLKIKVFMTDIKNRLLDAERASRLSRSALGNVSGLTEDWELDQKSLEAEKVSELKKDDIIQRTIKEKPELNQIDSLIQLKQAEYKVAQADLYPMFFLGAKMEYAKAPGRTDVSNPFLNDPFNSFNFGAVLGLKQNLGFFRTTKKLDGLDAEIQRLQAQRAQLELKSRLDAEKYFDEAFSAFSAVQLNEDGFRSARSWLTSTGLSFNLGTAETKDVLESFAAYFKARFDLIRNLYNFNIALAELTHVTSIEVVDRLKD